MAITRLYSLWLQLNIYSDALFTFDGDSELIYIFVVLVVEQQISLVQLREDDRGGCKGMHAMAKGRLGVVPRGHTRSRNAVGFIYFVALQTISIDTYQKVIKIMIRILPFCNLIRVFIGLHLVIYIKTCTGSNDHVSSLTL